MSKQGSKGASTNDDGEYAPSARPVQDGHYIRSRGTEREALEDLIGMNYKLDRKSAWNPRVWIFSSGMNAISSLMMNEFYTHLQAGIQEIVFIVGNVLYCDTYRVLDYLAAHSSGMFSYVRINPSDQEEVEEAFRTHGSKIKMLFLESCANPSGHMFNYAQLKGLRKKAPGCKVVVDNTWLTHVLFNPFEHDVDHVVLSLTKYYSGGSAIAGAVIGTKKKMSELIKYALMSGVHVDPIQCATIRAGVLAMKTRVQKAGDVARVVAMWLEEQQCVHRVMYPLLDSHPSAEINSTLLLKGGPACIWFHTAGAKKAVQSWVERAGVSHIKFETSFGDSYCKIDPWPENGLSTKYDRGGTPVDGVWLRLSLGFDVSASDTLADLSRLFEQPMMSEG